MAVQIKSVKHGSLADKNDIKSKDKLISINGNEIMDVLDYRFYQTDANIKLKVLDADSGLEREIFLRKREYEEIGLEFDTYLMDDQKSCRNKCIFCFIDQLPKGMRDSLYFKDDDSRLSFLFGNYITLTNLSEHEIERIIKMHISPINVSIHTTNKELRVKMMNNRFAGETLEILKRLKKASIKINCQIVCCPGINDGDELVKTLNDLKKFFPSVESVSVVPVGLTRYREGLYPLVNYNSKTASEVIDIVESFANECLSELGTRIAFAADEFYIKAGRPFHDADFYEEFKQLENGVGAVSLLNEEFYFALKQSDYSLEKRHITIACGKAIKENMSGLLKDACSKFRGLSGEVVGIENKFFGEKTSRN